MVWIHGGGFNMGSGDRLIYGPDFLVRHDVILVTINYRLSAFGEFTVVWSEFFLSPENIYCFLVLKY